MRRSRVRKRLAAIALVLGASMVPLTAIAQEPQPVSESACNEGTRDARATAPEPADNSVPHEGRTGHCHHAVPSSG
jgi:hypothetical protein